MFEVTYNGSSAVWKDLSYNLGDQPITAIVRDDKTVISTPEQTSASPMLKAGTHGGSRRLPDCRRSRSTGCTIDSKSTVVYAATHGRGIWKLAWGSSSRPEQGRRGSAMERESRRGLQAGSGARLLETPIALPLPD